MTTDRADAWDEDDDGLDYELEPPDEDVVRLARRRASEDVAEAERSIDVDAVYRELQGRGAEDAAWEPSDFRFGVRELLIATGVVALLLGVWRVGLLGPGAFAGFIAVSLIGLGAAHTYLAWRERRRHEVLIARQRYELAKARGDLDDGEAPAPPPPTLGPAWDELKTTLRDTLRFGVRELLLLTVFVALLMVPVRFLGAGATAALVGLTVLAGLALQAADFELPRPVVLVWWLLILAYCALMVGQLIAGLLGFV